LKPIANMPDSNWKEAHIESLHQKISLKEQVIIKDLMINWQDVPLYHYCGITNKIWNGAPYLTKKLQWHNYTFKTTRQQRRHF